jgi:hypothetical protein
MTLSLFGLSKARRCFFPVKEEHRRFCTTDQHDSLGTEGIGEFLGLEFELGHGGMVSRAGSPRLYMASKTSTLTERTKNTKPSQHRRKLTQFCPQIASARIILNY